MSTREDPLFEALMQAFQAQMAQSKTMSQRLIMLLAEARMQADVQAYQAELQASLPPASTRLQRVRQFLTQRLTLRKAQTRPLHPPMDFPWAVDATYVVLDDGKVVGPNSQPERKAKKHYG